jgi:hypothetical protein
MGEPKIGWEVALSMNRWWINRGSSGYPRIMRARPCDPSVVRGRKVCTNAKGGYPGIEPSMIGTGFTKPTPSR